MNIKSVSLLVLFCLSFYMSNSQTAHEKKGFKIIPLGVRGGLDESNLSSYLVAANGTNEFICLDAGTIYSGLQKAIENNLFPEKQASITQNKYIQGYFISHAHLDHVAGLVMNAPNDNSKNIYGFYSVLDVFKKNHFSWSSWANFANEGEKPNIGKYTYHYLTHGKEILADNTSLYVTPYLLSHVKPYESSAFLIRNQTDYLLYLGDTGSDKVEGSNQLRNLWTIMAEKIKQNSLKAIFIEASFEDEVPQKSLFGHLTPQLLLQELRLLNTLADNQLKNVKIFVTHIKPCENCEIKIKQQIEKANDMGLNFIFPEQGTLIEINP